MLCITPAKIKFPHISNKREVTLIVFEKKNPPSTFIDFFYIFDPPLLVYCSYALIFFQKIPPSTCIDFAIFFTPSTFIPTSSAIRYIRVLPELLSKLLHRISKYVLTFRSLFMHRIANGFHNITIGLCFRENPLERRHHGGGDYFWTGASLWKCLTKCSNHHGFFFTSG